MSELSWNRNEKIENILAVGQEVTVRVSFVDWEGNRLTLSLKALQPDPWSLAAGEVPCGRRCEWYDSQACAVWRICES